MRWTEQPPTKPGWYWVYRGELLQEVVHIIGPEESSLHSVWYPHEVALDEEGVMLDEFNETLWFGPVDPPDFSEAGKTHKKVFGCWEVSLD